jgi:hypothetical protein
LTIDDPELKKVQGYRCPNSLADKGCAIYERRPNMCRTFFCGWRLLKWVPEPLRPDRSGVLIRLHGERLRQTGGHKLGIIVTLLTNAAIKSEGLAETVAAAVASDAPVYLNVPGPPGYTGSQARLNEALVDAVQTKNKEAVLQILRQARAKGRSGPRRAIVLATDETTEG